jgi:hypothetical protein
MVRMAAAGEERVLGTAEQELKRIAGAEPDMGMPGEIGLAREEAGRVK